MFISTEPLILHFIIFTLLVLRPVSDKITNIGQTPKGFPQGYILAALFT